jgi:GH25 family lysozyme M1 (1,4-beta-N-acetylmuramidase)
MKIIVDEIFNYWANMYSFEEGSPEYLVDKEDFKQAMKEFAEKLLELAAENATTYTSDKFLIMNIMLKKNL